ncbi:MAG TPA: ABC transporter permease [Candidatus Limnocylindria bacterium]|nr:ABC transporter permease [Candidatus Limnocylindria bacterium]
MDFILHFPVIGLLLQFVGYMVEVVLLNGGLIITLATPIGLGALCGFMNERSGVVNIGIEGMMLASAFGAWYVASIASSFMPDATGPLGITLPLLIGLLAGLATGVLVSLAHAWLSISVRADQIISGTIINIVALGITGYLALLISQNSPRSAGNFGSVSLPQPVTDIPVLGWILRTFVEHGPITLSMLVLVVVLQVLLYRSRWGLRTRAVGEHPRAAETVGIDVIALRYRNVLLGGLLAGLAGAWFTIEYGNSFQSGMTNGRGFIALAALIFGRWTPLGSVGAALLFGFADTLGRAIRQTPPAGDLGVVLGAIPPQVFAALPYIVTIIVLAGVVGRSIPPAADGQPYEREATAR